MIRKFGDLPIRSKLTVIVSIASTFTVLAMAVFFVTNKVLAFRRNMTVNLSTLAEVVGINSTASLTFDVPETAREILAALHAEPEISFAAILKPDGSLFASYRNPGLPADAPFDKEAFKRLLHRFQTPDAEQRGRTRGHLFSTNYLDIVEPIPLGDQVIGYVVIRADLGPLNSRIAMSVLVVLGVTTLLFTGVHLITRRLHRTIVEPIADLSHAMAAVSERGDYTARVVKKNNDEIGGLIAGFNEMLSQIQKRDEELAMHRDRLEEAVARRTAELTASNARLKKEMDQRAAVQEKLTRAQKMEVIGTLASGVAHDLNNILSGIVSYPDLLLLNLPEDSPLRKPILTIQNSGLKAAAIVQDLLTLARRGVGNSEPVDLKALIDTYLNSPVHQKLIAYHPNVRVETEVDPDVATIMGSPVHLDKTLMNMVSNAAEAMPEGGVISIGLTRCYIDRPLPGYDAVEEGDYVLLTVSDTGVGIPREDRQRIFEPFYTKKKMGRSGTGLGMAVVWGTVMDHDGYIDVESETGRGTTFYLYFPAARGQTACAVETASPAADLRGNGETILVVDDVPEQREIAVRLLEALGYTALAVATGEAAVDHLNAHEVDLVLLDMIMDPGMDGLETYRRIAGRHPRQRAIIASGFSESDRVKQAQQLGAGAYVRKPYTLDKIARAVKEELSTRRR